MVLEDEKSKNEERNKKEDFSFIKKISGLNKGLLKYKSISSEVVRIQVFLVSVLRILLGEKTLDCEWLISHLFHLLQLHTRSDSIWAG